MGNTRRKIAVKTDNRSNRCRRAGFCQLNEVEYEKRKRAIRRFYQLPQRGRLAIRQAPAGYSGSQGIQRFLRYQQPEKRQLQRRDPGLYQKLQGFYHHPFAPFPGSLCQSGGLGA